jgi:hypothetical protein
VCAQSALTGPHARRAGMGAQSESNCVNAAGIWDKNEFHQAAFAMGTLGALERGERTPT